SDGRGVVRAPTYAVDFYFLLMTRANRLALDSLDLEKCIECHADLSWVPVLYCLPTKTCALRSLRRSPVCAAAGKSGLKIENPISPAAANPLPAASKSSARRAGNAGAKTPLPDSIRA